MGRIEPAHGNRKLMEADAPPTALTVELAKLKLSMLSKEARCYDVLYMNVTVGSYPSPLTNRART